MAGGFFERLKAGFGRTAEAMANLLSRPIDGQTAEQLRERLIAADFDLTEAQFAKIKKLHDAYSLVCAEHCREIQMATRSRNELRVAEGADAVSLAAADRRVEELRLICESAIATHVRQCADLMSLSARERYLALVLPKIKDFDHTAAPDLLINHGRH